MNIQSRYGFKKDILIVNVTTINPFSVFSTREKLDKSQVNYLCADENNNGMALFCLIVFFWHAFHYLIL